MLIKQGQWRALTGKSYGLTMPVLLGKLHVDTCLAPQWQQVNQQLTHLLSTKAVILTEQCSPHLVINAVLTWLHTIQQNSRQPVFETGRIIDKLSTTEQQITFTIALPYLHARATIDALSWLIKTINNLSNNQTEQQTQQPQKQLATSYASLERKLRRFATSGSNTYPFLQAAHDLAMPWSHVTGNIFQIGYGVSNRWLDSSFTDKTSVIGARFARNKQLTATVLAKSGLPTAQHFVIRTTNTALKMAERLGYPVVIKPADKDRGIGVSAGIQNTEQLLTALRKAQKVSRNILIEKHIEGQDYRLTVLNGKMIWAILRQPGGVIGNGIDSIKTLVDKTNADPRRQQHRHAPLKSIIIDEEATELLAHASFTINDIPEPEQFIRLRRTSNISTGGTPIAAMQVHPDNQRLAENAAAALKLDFAGIDLIIADIRQSWLKSGGVICEVNGQPQLGLVTNPQIYADCLQVLVKNKGRIPIVVIIADNNVVNITDHLFQLWSQTQAHIAIATEHGFTVNNQLVAQTENILIASQAALNSTTVEALIVVSSPAEISKYGVAVDYYDVLIMAAQPSVTTVTDIVYKMLFSHNVNTIVTHAHDQQSIRYAKQYAICNLQLVTDGEDLCQQLAITAYQALSVSND
ncbi:hypothetical protein A9Q78_02180 [Methylophaga sp. 41_12_T18]|nr:hypothetical protein A9Q78_02180 [Methylophaga sp. 41_12_T18]